MFKVSQSAIEQVSRDIQAGKDEHVKQFFASRPEWLDQDDKPTKQADEKKQEEKS